MSEVKQVKVDNWGIFFLQRLKHFFNRTDYCDLTLQFQDNAQLKVHRLVLSACTEYFELLERTCEMYEDCLVMPDDLQADVVVPIVNFMYTGQLEFRMDLLERLYQTSLVMNMPVLTKLLDAHRAQPINRDIPSHSYSNPKRYKSYDTSKHFSTPSSSHATNNKRSYGKAFENHTSHQKYRKSVTNKCDFEINDMISQPNAASIAYQGFTPKKQILSEPRPTRYELPEELEAENIFDNSFANISYTSKPLMVHPETTKRYPSKRSGIFEDPSTSKRFIHGRSTMDIVECKKISVSDHIFDDDPPDTLCDTQDSYPQQMSTKMDSRDSNQLFDQILDNGGPKVTIETKDSKQASNLDHAKIISEVLKKYPHLVKSNKNIKLKILNTPSKKRTRQLNTTEDEKDVVKAVKPENDFTFETEVIDSKEAAKLIALGAENVKGPWICLICGAPGKAIHFTSYYKFRRHLVEVHNEKPVLNLCEYCGQKSMKRNYLLHHLYTKHGIPPPPQYNFPKCNICNYIALNEGFLIKHKITHSEKQTFRCNVCTSSFLTSNQLLMHIQKTGHKYSAEKKINLQCIYCFKVFLRESNLYAHLRTNHKEAVKNDGILETSDNESSEVNEKEKVIVKSPAKQEVYKFDVPVSYKSDYEDADIQYQIQQQPDGNIQVVSKKPRVLLPTIKHKILNPGFSMPSNKIVPKPILGSNNPIKQNEYLHNPNISIENQTDEIVVIDNNEYIVKDNQLLPKKDKSKGNEGYSMPDIMHTNIEESVHNIIPATTVDFTNVQTTNSEEHKMIVKKTGSINQPIQIVVSNEEEYKALMASNHSIIFEDGDAGKTLTVLTGPHDNNTTIDLDNTRSNDMMIIQDDYPLNVSEAVSGDNSNIVVVYSHPVDDQHKEYQLITSENIGAQFVTSSGIITQSYETVTTSAPVMNTNILETPVEDSWQNSIPQNMAPAIEMEIPISSNQGTNTPIESQLSNIADIQAVQLAPDSSKAVQIHPTADEVINQTISEQHNLNETGTVVITDVQPDLITTSEAQAVYVDTMNSVTISNINAEENNHVIVENEPTDQYKDLNNDSEKVLKENVTKNTLITNEVAAESSIQHPFNGNPNTNTDEIADTDTIENISKEIQTSASTPVAVPVNTEVHTSVIIESLNNREVSLTKAKEQIENLTSEWSDDEMESTGQDQSSIPQDNCQTKTAECEAMDAESQSEIEESIENIQHEIKKQFERPLRRLSVLHDAVQMTVAEGTGVLQEGCPLSSQETEHVNKAIISNESNKTPVKISSLLNDWEDNDSQEDDVSSPIVENKENTEFVEECVPSEEITQNTNSMDVDPVNIKQNVEVDSKAGESIKSLVSDWIEDDEEEEAQNK